MSDSKPEDTKRSDKKGFILGASVLIGAFASCAIGTGIVSDINNRVDGDALPTRVILPTDLPPNQEDADGIKFPTYIPETLDTYITPTEEQFYFEQIMDIRPETYRVGYDFEDLMRVTFYSQLFENMPENWIFFDLQVHIFKNSGDVNGTNLTEIHIKHRDDVYLIFTTLPKIISDNDVSIPLIADIYGTEGTDFESFLDALKLWSEYLDIEN